MQNLFLSSVGYFQFFFLRADDAVERPLFNVTHISWAILTDKCSIYCDSGTKLANSIHRVFNRNELVSIACDVHQYPVQDHPGHLRAVTIITFSHFYFPCIILIWLINWPFLLHTRKHICRISFENTFDYYYFIYFITHIIIYFSFSSFLFASVSSPEISNFGISLPPAPAKGTPNRLSTRGRLYFYPNFDDLAVLSIIWYFDRRRRSAVGWRREYPRGRDAPPLPLKNTVII